MSGSSLTASWSIPVWQPPIEKACDCDVLVTTTPSTTPIVRSEWIHEGTHINAIGADAPGKEELDPALLRRAQVFVDDMAQAVHSGEINVPISHGTLSCGRDCRHARGGRDREEAPVGCRRRSPFLTPPVLPSRISPSRRSRCSTAGRSSCRSRESVEGGSDWNPHLLLLNRYEPPREVGGVAAPPPLLAGSDPRINFESRKWLTVEGSGGAAGRCNIPDPIFERGVGGEPPHLHFFIRMNPPAFPEQGGGLPPPVSFLGQVFPKSPTVVQIPFRFWHERRRVK